MKDPGPLMLGPESLPGWTLLSWPSYWLVVTVIPNWLVVTVIHGKEQLATVGSECVEFTCGTVSRATL